jgi:hypothetical protein
MVACGVEDEVIVAAPVGGIVAGLVNDLIGRRSSGQSGGGQWRYPFAKRQAHVPMGSAWIPTGHRTHR